MIQGFSCIGSRVVPSETLSRCACKQRTLTAASALAQKRSPLRHFSASVLVASFKKFGLSKRSEGKSWLVKCTLDTSGGPSGGDGSDPNSKSPFGLGSTRLGRLVLARQQQLIQRWNTVRQNFPAKIFLLLLGFYSANALATILGQTGDWDVLAAGIMVTVIEGIGYLMYRMPPFLGKRTKWLVEFMNYWKAGFSFGLFVDAFKLGS